MNESRLGRAARRGGMVAAVVAASLLVTSCGGGSQPGSTSGEGSPEGGPADQKQWDDIVTAAEAEGEVLVYTSMLNLEETFAHFEDQYPEIKVRIERAPPGDLVTRLDQEISVGVAGGDVTFHSQDDWFLARNGDDMSFTPLAISPENIDAGWEERLGGDEYFPAHGMPFTISYNTKTGEEVTDADQLLALPESARFGMIDPRLTPAIAYQYQLWMDEYGDDFLEKLSKRNVTVYPSTVPAGQALAAGEFDYGFALTPAATSALEAEGAPVVARVPENAKAGFRTSAAVLKNAPHPNAAQVFANWLIGQGGAEALVLPPQAPSSVPLDAEGGVPWETMAYPDSTEWTTEYWEAWLAEEWDPFFG